MSLIPAEEEEERSFPCVVVSGGGGAGAGGAGGAGGPELELIRQILGSKTLPEPTRRDEPVSWFPWTINNKYYTADVQLCAVPSTFQMTSEIAQSMQAFIAYFDSTMKEGLEKLRPWVSVVEDLAPEVLILVCDRVCENGVSRHEAQQWCLAHGFELVELNPQELPDEDGMLLFGAKLFIRVTPATRGTTFCNRETGLELGSRDAVEEKSLLIKLTDDDFPESTGIKRIVQALNANVWSSVEMKDGHNQGFGLMSSLVAARHNNPRSCPDPPSSSSPVEGTVVNEEATHTERRADSDSDTQQDAVVDAMTDLDIQELANLTAGDADVDNFERLFTKLKEMKDKASSLPHEQRKVHAEKVAKAFWMAIGGDDDEIDGLSSGEES